MRHLLRGRRRVSVLVGLVLMAAAVWAAPAAANVAAPGGAWYWQNPTPQGNDLSSTWFADANTGWVVGGAATIEKTVNGGATWTPETDPAAPQYLEDVAFADARNGWIVGDAGTILATTNGGASWTAQVSPTPGNLYGLYVLDALNVYAVGQGGVVLHTVNGGANWLAQPSPTLSDLYAVTFRSLNNGWAVGDGGVALHTNNGGLTWSPQDSGVGATLYGVGFVSLYQGWAVGAGGTAVHTINGGSIWSAQNSGSTADLHDIAAMSADEAWVAGTAGTMLHTTDGGSNWASQDCGTGNDLYGLAAVSSKDVRAVGAGGVVTRTVDGATWTPLWSTATGVATLRGVSFADGLDGWAVGNAGVVLHTANGGATWQGQDPGVGQQLNAVQASTVAGVTYVWAVGNRPANTQPGVIRASTDGGLTWTGQTSPVNQSLNAVDFVDNANGWAVGNAATIVHTPNDGSTAWANQNAGNPLGLGVLHGVSFANINAGVVVGAGGSIAYTINGGTTWSAGASGTGNELDAVQMVDPLNAWAVGVLGTILHSTDGGATWSAQNSPVGDNLHAVHFSDALNGIALGDNGDVVTTTDGGTTWVAQQTACDQGIYGVASWTGPPGIGQHLWVCGGNASILSNFDPNTLAVSALKGVPGDGQITVSWTNPSSGFGAAMAYYSTLRCASSVDDTYGQSLAYEGTGSSLVRTGLQNNTAYYFTVFVRDTAGTWSTPQTLAVVPIPTFKLTLAVTPATATVGHAIKFSGKVTPAGAATGQYVQLQRFTGSWKTFVKVKVSASGAFSVSKSLPRGSYRVRAYLPGTTAALAGVSATRYATWK